MLIPLFLPQTEDKPLAPIKPPVKSTFFFKFIFLISQPKHMVYVLKRTISKITRRNALSFITGSSCFSKKVSIELHKKGMQISCCLFWMSTYTSFYIVNHICEK